MTESRIHWSAYQVTRSLLLVMSVLVAASSAVRAMVHVTGHDYMKGLVPLVYVDAESNVPTFFSVVIALAASSLLALTGTLERARNGPLVSRWLALSTGFLLIAADDFMSLHERLTNPIRELADGAAGNAFHYGWVVVGLPLVLIVGLAFQSFLDELPPRTRRSFLIAGAMFVGGALGLEVLGGIVAASAGADSVLHSVLATAEETLEMLGVILFIRAIMHYMASEFGSVTISLDAGGTSHP